MPGLGTVINVLFIVIGGLLGVLFGNRLSEKSRETLMLANAVSVLFIGIAGALQQMFVLAAGGKLESTGTMMLIASLAIGAVLGEWIDLETRIERFGEWLKEKSGNAEDAGFVNAFVTASLTVCVGAMAIVGSIEDGTAGNHSILFVKAVLDLIIVMVMAASLGKGCIFSAIPVGLLQSLVTVLSVMIRPYITDQAMANLSLVGSVLIFCVGVNLFWGKRSGSRTCFRPWRWQLSGQCFHEGMMGRQVFLQDEIRPGGRMPFTKRILVSLADIIHC